MESVVDLMSCACPPAIFFEGDNVPMVVDEFDGCFLYVSLGIGKVGDISLLSSSGRCVVPIGSAGDVCWEVWSVSGGNWGIVGCEGVVEGCQGGVTSVAFVPGILVLFWLRPGLGGRRFCVGYRLWHRSKRGEEWLDCGGTTVLVRRQVLRPAWWRVSAIAYSASTLWYSTSVSFST